MTFAPEVCRQGVGATVSVGSMVTLDYVAQMPLEVPTTTSSFCCAFEERDRHVAEATSPLRRSHQRSTALLDEVALSRAVAGAGAGARAARRASLCASVRVCVRRVTTRHVGRGGRAV